MKTLFWLGIMVLTQISRSRFKQSNLFSHPTYLRFGPFCKFFGNFWVYLEINIVFLKGLVKFMEIGNLEDLILF